MKKEPSGDPPRPASAASTPITAPAPSSVGTIASPTPVASPTTAESPPSSGPPSTKEHRAAWERFKRTLEPGTGLERSNRNAHIPMELAVQAGTMDGKKTLFQLWLQSNGDWGQVNVSEHVKETSRTKEEVNFSWLTFAQIKDTYKDDTVAAALVQAKKSVKGCVRAHPDIPHIVEATQYKVTNNDLWDSD